MPIRFPSNLSWSLLAGLTFVLTGIAQASTFQFPCNSYQVRTDLACIFDTFNRDGVYNNPPILPTFTIASSTPIFAIETYHWNGGAGQDPLAVNGHIAIYNDTTGQLVGSWPASRSTPTLKILWTAYPGITLSPGTYRIVDSDPATWSYSLTNYFHRPGDGPDWKPRVGFARLFMPLLKCSASGTGANYLRVCLTQHGNVVGFQSPSGKEHIAVGTIVEGYVACAKPTASAAVVSYFDATSSEKGWADPYKVTLSPTKVYRKTLDQKLELVQSFANVAGQTAFSVTMTLTNRSGTTLFGVRLDRYADFDVANTWTDDQFDRSNKAIFAYEGNSQVSLTNLSTLASATAVHRNGSGWPLDKCNAASAPTPTAPGDWAGRLSFSFGTMAAGTSKTVKLVYRVQ